MDWKTIISLIGAFSAIIAAIIAGCIALWTTRKSRKASEKLAKQQKEYTAQIETLKNQLAFELARKTKFAEKEFEVLDEGYKKFMVCYEAIKPTAIGGLIYIQSYINRPDFLKQLAELPFEHCKVMLELRTKLPTEKCALVANEAFEKRLASYLSELAGVYIDKVGSFSIIYSDYYNKYCIFIPPILKKSFQECLAEIQKISLFAINFAEKLSHATNEQCKDLLAGYEADLLPALQSLQDLSYVLEEQITAELFPNEEKKKGVERDKRKGQGSSGGES